MDVHRGFFIFIICDDQPRYDHGGEERHTHPFPTIYVVSQYYVHTCSILILHISCIDYGSILITMYLKWLHHIM